MDHKITYELKGVSRKELAKAISEVLITDSVYKGVPSCAYEIGDLILDREGSCRDTMTPGVDSLVSLKRFYIHKLQKMPLMAMVQCPGICSQTRH